MRLIALLILWPGIAFAGCLGDCQVDEIGYALIKNAEGYSPFIYKDVGGIPTIGFGHAIQAGEHIRMPLMGPDALTLLESDVKARIGPLNHFIHVPLSADQFDAVASLGYNIGLGNVKRSTLLKRINAKRHKEVPPQFLVWDKAAGHEVTGLKIRRRAEAMLYKRGTE